MNQPSCFSFGRDIVKEQTDRNIKVQKESAKLKASSRSKMFANAYKALDAKNIHFYQALSDEDRKLVEWYPIFLGVSSIQHDNLLAEYYITASAKYVNSTLLNAALKDFPQLKWLLLCTISPFPQTGLFHPWISSKKEKMEKRVRFLSTEYPSMSTSDLKFLSTIITDAELYQFLFDRGATDDEIKSKLVSAGITRTEIKKLQKENE